METTTTTTNTNNSQYGIREDAEFSLGAIMDVTESSHDGEVDAINQVKLTVGWISLLIICLTWSSSQIVLL